MVVVEVVGVVAVEVAVVVVVVVGVVVVVSVVVEVVEDVVNASTGSKIATTKIRIQNNHRESVTSIAMF